MNAEMPLEKMEVKQADHFRSDVHELNISTHLSGKLISEKRHQSARWQGILAQNHLVHIGTL
jgi:hypothetical protein